MGGGGRSRGRKHLFRLVTVLGALFVGLGVAEVAVRMAGLGTATLSRGRLHAYDADAGWKCTPNLDARYVQPNSFDVRITTNARGLRDGPIEFAKPEGMKRVVVLGDSFMWGYGVEDDETYASVLERELDGVQTVNLGANGYSTVQEAVRLECEGLLYDPDVVVLAFTWNDVSSNLHDKDGGRPYAGLGPDGCLDILNRPVRKPWKSPVIQWLRHNSRLFNFMEYCTATYKSRAAAKRQRESRDEDGAAAGTSSSEATTKKPLVAQDITVLDVFGRPVGAAAHSWEVLERVIERIRDDARGANAKLVLVNNTSREEVFPVLLWHLGGVSEEEARELELDPDRAGRILGEIAARLGIEYVDPTPLFRAHAAPESLFLVNNGHWTPAGHRLAASALLPKLESMLKE